MYSVYDCPLFLFVLETVYMPLLLEPFKTLILQAQFNDTGMSHDIYLYFRRVLETKKNTVFERNVFMKFCTLKRSVENEILSLYNRYYVQPMSGVYLKMSNKGEGA